MQVWIVTPCQVMQAFGLLIEQEGEKHNLVAECIHGTLVLDTYETLDAAMKVLAQLDPTKQNGQINVLCLDVPVEGRPNVRVIQSPDEEVEE